MGEECKGGELEIQPMSQEIARRLCRAKKRDPNIPIPLRFFGILPIHGRGAMPT